MDDTDVLEELKWPFQAFLVLLLDSSDAHHLSINNLIKLRRKNALPD